MSVGIGMIGPLVRAFALSLALAGAASSAELKYIFQDRTDHEGVRVEFLPGGLAAPVVLPKEAGEWTHTIPLTFDGWAIDPMFVVHFERRPNDDWPIDFESFSIGLPVHVTRLDEGTIVVPVYLFRSISGRELDRLERLTRDDQLLERRFLSEQIARHNIGVFGGYRDRVVVRAVANWFNAAYSLTVKHNNRFRFSDEAAHAANETGSGARQFRQSGEEAASLFWRDINHFPRMLREGQCELAAQVLHYVTDMHGRNPQLAQYQLGGLQPDDVFAERQRMLAEACP